MLPLKSLLSSQSHTLDNSTVMHVITQVRHLAFILPLTPPQLHHPSLSVCPPECHLDLSSPFHLH